MTQAKTVTVALVAFDKRIHLLDLLEVADEETPPKTMCGRGTGRQAPFGTRSLDAAHLAVLRGDAKSYCRLCVLAASALLSH